MTAGAVVRPDFVEVENGLRKRVDGKQVPGLDADEISDAKAGAGSDYESIALLLVLYTLQGLPMGLSAAFTMILKERGATFSEMGTFSLVSWPFSLKLLWAPLVDTVYIRRIGRRKTWLVPAQLLIGLVLLTMSSSVETLLYGERPAVATLTGVFFLLYLLCATQDIAVDGWALTMLRAENVGWAATCNAAGQTLGTAFGFTGYMMLEQVWLVTLSSFLKFLGLVFVTVTLLVATLKTERPVPPEDEPDGIAKTYGLLLVMMKLRPVQILVLVLVTWKAAFPITDAIAPLKFQELGVPKEHLAYMSSVLMPMYVALPVLIAGWTSGKTPLNLAVQAYPVRVLTVGVTAAVVYHTPSGLASFPNAWYGVIFLVTAVSSAASQFMFVSNMAFFARISDPALGGTYMTLLNTLSNLGGMWPPTLTFYLVDALTCQEPHCRVSSDGFYVVAVLCVLIGSAWYMLGVPVIARLQALKLEEWHVR